MHFSFWFFPLPLAQVHFRAMISIRFLGLMSLASLLAVEWFSEASHALHAILLPVVLPVFLFDSTHSSRKRRFGRMKRNEFLNCRGWARSMWFRLGDEGMIQCSTLLATFDDLIASLQTLRCKRIR